MSRIASATSEGLEYHNCTVCGHEETRPIDRLPYTPVTPPVMPVTPTPAPTPTPTPGTDIPDTEVPLANATGLNDQEHFAYITGYPDGTVQPMKNITRAEFAAIAARFVSDDVTDNGTGGFSDTADHWAAKEVRLAVKAGWVKGDGNSFRPNDPINRAEVMALVNRMLDRTPDPDHMLSNMKTWSDNPAGTWCYAAVQEATNGHGYERGEDGATEIWTELTPAKDWDALLAGWTATNGAAHQILLY